MIVEIIKQQVIQALGKPTDRYFGSGRVGVNNLLRLLDSQESDEIIWRGGLVASDNGCPRAVRNFVNQIERHKGNVRDGIMAYVEAHEPVNFMWGYLKERVFSQFKDLNNALYEDLIKGVEVVPDIESYDYEAVPPSYHVSRARTGVARDSAYFLTKAILLRQDQGIAAGLDKAQIFTDSITTLREIACDADVLTTSDLQNRFMARYDIAVDNLL